MYLVGHGPSRLLYPRRYCQFDKMAAMGKQAIYIVTGFVLSTILILVLSKRQRESLWKYLPLRPRSRRISSSGTPPRSLSPEKKSPENMPPPVDYRDIYPPSRRETLLKVAESLSAGQKAKLKGHEVDGSVFRKGVIPFTTDYRECGPSMYTPMEISIEEVHALGDFPDYAELSGVPLPEAYKEFHIETAIPRPYRPMRWAYHQTMCMSDLARVIVHRTNAQYSAHQTRT